jgi:endopeptidase La
MDSTINEQICQKLDFFKDVIQKTIISVHKNKKLGIITLSEQIGCVSTMKTVGDCLSVLENEIDKKVINKEGIVSKLQQINNDLSYILKKYGTYSIEDLLTICFGYSKTFINSEEEKHIYELLKKYFHPTNYGLLNIKKEDDEPNDKNMKCSDISIYSKNFHLKMHGLKVFVYNKALNKHLIIQGYVDDVVIEILNNRYITTKINSIKNNLPGNIKTTPELFYLFLSSFSLKDFLVNNDEDIYKKYAGQITQQKVIKQKSLQQIVKDFTSGDLFVKRTMIMQLIFSDEQENKYISYLLYDLLSNDGSMNTTTEEQEMLLDSFPWPIKDNFKESMTKIIQYTNELNNADVNKIPLEQQICLLKVPDSVKEKAMSKLKEIKSKSDDSGSKARQYLDGLLKIPFGVYIKEPIMNIMNENKNLLCEIYKDIDVNSLSTVDMLSRLKQLRESILNESEIKKIKTFISKMEKQELISLLKKEKDINVTKTMSKKKLVEQVYSFIDENKNNFEIISSIKGLILNDNNNNNIVNVIKNIDLNFNKIKQYVTNIKNIMDDAVYGHDNAKKQIEKIIGQWINGEQKGYCFGFEGPPGVGKTSLAKNGLSICLRDENGRPRPFSMIQMGGDSNGSTLHGHNYTYVGSTWGGIVQILIDKKCMNPIILIDELDKISRTEHGREIVSILTHLLDPTQNECFQDKYFSGIDLDLSRCLFILSYNDVDAIDKVLLDRIHRIKFNSLSIEDKLVILNKHLLPEIYSRMGLDGAINIDEDVLRFIINEYTCEPGVRKLKEIIFEIVGDINLDILKGNNTKLPIQITRDDIKNKYLKDRHEIKMKLIHSENQIGIINGLWANAMGRGGIIPIQTTFFPADSFLQLKLTGMQGDVMKESMNVALTLAWKLTDDSIKNIIMDNHKEKKCGIHIHCPEGAVPKDGPSAGTAITVVLYSLLNNKRIKHNMAITGEISLDGEITEIGGLDLKILGGLKAGVKSFIFPRENDRDFKLFMEKYCNGELLDDITFYQVNHISEVLNLIFEK